jgi:proline dehydrogenase
VLRFLAQRRPALHDPPKPVNPLIRLIPPFLVRFFARPYVAGDSLQKAIDTAAGLLSGRGLASSLDKLAENIDDEETVQRNLATYLEMVDAIAADPRFADPALRPTVSMKLSSYTTRPMDKGGDARGAAEAIFAIARRAQQRGVRTTLDMESRHWTDFTLRLLRELHAEGLTEVGCVLQSRLNRTERDLLELPAGIRVRLVIGIYAEPAEVAIADKVAMKERMLTAAKVLLERGHYVEFATHDERYVRRFLDEVVPATGAAADRFEVQMLYGVPRERLLSDVRARGVVARLYVPFAIGWPMAIAYLRRRLDEYPAMIFLVLRNWLFRG